jgi:hypothetical protein
LSGGVGEKKQLGAKGTLTESENRLHQVGGVGAKKMGGGERKKRATRLLGVNRKRLCENEAEDFFGADLSCSSKYKSEKEKEEKIFWVEEGKGFKRTLIGLE